MAVGRCPGLACCAPLGRRLRPPSPDGRRFFWLLRHRRALDLCGFATQGDLSTAEFTFKVLARKRPVHHIRCMKFITAIVALAFSAAGFAVEPITIKLWPEGAPGTMLLKPTATQQAPNPNVITPVTEPTIAVYRPEKPNNTAVVVAP